MPEEKAADRKTDPEASSSGQLLKDLADGLARPFEHGGALALRYVLRFNEKAAREFQNLSYGIEGIALRPNAQERLSSGQVSALGRLDTSALCRLALGPPLTGGGIESRLEDGPTPSRCKIIAVSVKLASVRPDTNQWLSAIWSLRWWIQREGDPMHPTPGAHQGTEAGFAQPSSVQADPAGYARLPTNPFLWDLGTQLSMALKWGVASNDKGPAFQPCNLRYNDWASNGPDGVGWKTLGAYRSMEARDRQVVGFVFGYILASS